MDTGKAMAIIKEKATIIGFLDFQVHENVLDRENADNLKQYLEWLAKQIQFAMLINQIKIMRVKGIY